MQILKDKLFLKLNHLLPSITNTIVVAVSGGADSMALTLLLKDYAKLNNHQLQAVTIDHKLRAESTEEAQWVCKTLSNLGISHHILIWDHNNNINRCHERARSARYELLENFCKNYSNPVLLTAHHKQDQVETILMRFLKGSGPTGFQGIQASRVENEVTIVRPLLEITPEELRDYLTLNGVSWIEDPSNHNTAYERTRIRKLVEDIKDWGQDGILTSASKVYGAQQTFEELAAEYASDFIISDTPLTIDQTKFFSCHKSIQLNWLRQQIWQIGCANYPKPHTTIEAILKILKQPRVSGYRISGCIINVGKNMIRIE